MSKKPTLTIRAENLTGYSELARAMGGDPATLLKKAKIPAAFLNHPDNRIDYSANLNLLTVTAAALKDPLFSFHLTQQQPGLSMGVVGQMALASATVRDALQGSIQSFYLQSEAGIWSLHEDGDFSTITRKDVLPDHLIDQQVPLYNLTKAVSGLRIFLGRKWRPKAVYFDREIEGDIRELRRFFNAPLKFNHEFCGLLIRTADLDEPLETADNELRTTLNKYVEILLSECAEGGDFTSRVKILIERTLSSRRCTADFIADMLSLHTKALSRRLNSEGTSFRRLLKEVQLEKARHYLSHTSLSVTEIAVLLGYSELSAFTRAFKKQTGLSPTDWQTSHRL
ncbi:MAG: AraC family transcriptional regulator ligand-binding domain-containing protein [bacterium]